MITLTLENALDGKVYFRELLDSYPTNNREELSQWVQSVINSEYEDCTRVLQKDLEYIFDSKFLFEEPYEEEPINEDHDMQMEIQENKIEQTNPPQFFLDIPKEAIQQEKERLIDVQKTVLMEREQLLKKFKSLHKTRNEKYNQIIGTLSKDFNESLSILSENDWSNSEAKLWSDKQC